MDAKTILSITKCGDLFPCGEAEARAKYRELAREWHPDINHAPEAAGVFAQITSLYTRALHLLENGQWEKTDYIQITKDNGKKIAVSYDTYFAFELGICYVTKTKVIYLFQNDKEKYYRNAVNRIHALQYSDQKMKDEISRFLPEIYQTFQTNNKEYVIVLNKAEDVHPLKNVYESFHERIDPKHVAWMMSRLYNLACYLKFSRLVHNGINLNNCFISPQTHSLFLLGGWWYATEEGERMLGTTKDIFAIMPVASKTSKKSSCLTDLESVKLLGRQLLGEINCRKLALNSSIPKPFVNFLISGSGNDSFEEFAKWDRALTDSYGKRTFVHMDIPDLYKKKGE